MKLRAGALAVLVLGALTGPALLLPAESAGAASLPPLPVVYSCTATDTIAPTGANTLTTIGTSVCSDPLGQPVRAPLDELDLLLGVHVARGARQRHRGARAGIDLPGELRRHHHGAGGIDVPALTGMHHRDGHRPRLRRHQYLHVLRIS